MNETAVALKIAAPPETLEPERPEASRLFFLVALMTLLGSTMLCWVYLGGIHALEGVSMTETLAALRVISAGAAAGLASLYIGLATWRHAWRIQLRKCRDQEHHWQLKAAGLEQCVRENQRANETLERSEANVRVELGEMTRKHGALQEELDKLKQVERAFTQERRSFESSKTVLELHVQAKKSELQNLQKRYELILNAAGEGICGWDLQGKAIFVNPAVARMTGRGVEELLGRTEKEIFHPEGPNDKEQGEQIFHRKGDTPFPVEFVRTRIEEGGRQTGSVLIFKDITERKRTEETLAQKAAELSRSNAELEQFAFVASHDLQEPLRKIQAFGDRLKTKSGQVLTPEAQDYLDRMQRAAERMRTLIDDLLAFSRVIRSGEPFARVDLAQTAREVIGDLELRIEKTGARVELGELPTLDADATQMRQLFLNLIGNALKFHRPGTPPVVKLSAEKSTSGSGEVFWEISVQDNGIGFEDQYAEKIFAVFQRLHGRDEYEGTGIGLAVCRRITDRHGGSIVAKGQLGHGATFTITVPARQSPATS